MTSIEGLTSPSLPYTLTSSEIPPEILSQWIVLDFHAQEYVSQLGNVTITFMTTSSTISIFDYMRAFVKLNVQDQRFFSGMITNVEFLGIRTISPQTDSVLTSVINFVEGSELYVYRITLQPKLNLLTRRTKCQIFQEMPLDEILIEIFTANGLLESKDYLIEIADLKPIPYCVQYCESDFNFISRLLEDQGVYYCYQQIDKGVEQTLTIKSSPSYVPIPVMYNNDGFKMGALYKLTIRSKITPDVFAGIDFNYTDPIMQTFGTTPPIPEAGVHFEYPSHRFTTPLEELKTANELRSTLTRSKVYECESTVPSLSAGNTFIVPNYPNKTLIDDEMFITQIEHFGHQLQTLSPNKPQYFNRFLAVRHDPEHLYQPDRVTPLPKIYGYQTAVVVGPLEAEMPDVAAVYAATKLEATAEEADEEVEEVEEEAEVGLESAEAAVPTPPPVFTDPQGRIAVKFIWNMPVDPQEIAEEEEDEAQEEALAAPEEAEGVAQEEAEEVKGVAETEEEAAETEASEAAAGDEAEMEDTEEAESEDTEEALDQASTAEEGILPPPPGSCWVRVMQNLAGPGYGTGFIPRIGMEVIIVFENGDPNRPVCVGCVYNGVNPIPEPLFEEKSRLVISTMGAPVATPEDPCPQNAIVMQDMPLDEQKILIYGQNQIVTRVMKLHETTVVSGNHTVNIPTGDSILNINGGNHNVQIDLGTIMISIAEGEITIKTDEGAINLIGTTINLIAEEGINIEAGAEINMTAGGDMSTEVGGASEISVGGDLSTEVIGAIEITAGADVAIEAGAACEVSAGADVSIEAGAACEVSAGADIAIQALGAIEVTGGADVAITAAGACEVTAAGDVAITAAGAAELTAGADVAVTGGGACEVTGGGDLALTAGGACEATAGGAVAIDAGAATEIGAGGAISLEAGGVINQTSTLNSIEAALVFMI